jgi:hypothetical protein
VWFIRFFHTTKDLGDPGSSRGTLERVRVDLTIYYIAKTQYAPCLQYYSFKFIKYLYLCFSVAFEAAEQKTTSVVPRALVSTPHFPAFYQEWCKFCKKKFLCRMLTLLPMTEKFLKNY